MPYPATDEDELIKRMPRSLANRAVANLGAQDAATARVNAANRIVTPFEGYARVAQYQEPGTEARTTYGAPPVDFPLSSNSASRFDLTGSASAAIDYNRGTASGRLPSFPLSPNPDADFGVSGAMDRADLVNRSVPPSVSSVISDEIGQRRSELAAQKQQIAERLGIMPPRPGTAVVLATGAERKKLLDNWSILENEDKGLLQEQHYTTVQRARDAHEELTRETHARGARGLTKLASAVAVINKSNPKGGAFDDAIGNWLLQNANDPDVAEVIGTPGYERILKPHLDSSAKTLETIERLQKHFGPNAKLTRVSPQGPSFDISEGGTSETKVPQAILTQHAKLAAEKADIAIQLADATQNYNVAKKETEKAAAKTLVDSATKSINKIDAQLGSLREQFPSLTPKAADGEPKQLDADGARALLKEAEGDKEKARALAKERGYKF